MKYAIVTGGARGLGLGIVRALLVDKVVDRIAVIDRALVPAPADVADSVEGFNGDVTDEAQIHAVVEAITAKFGPHPDVLCNNAGGGESGWFESGRDAEWHSVEIWRRYVELNLNSVYIVSREIVPRMVAGGAVCNTSSIAGMLATPFLAAYAAAKAAVISYTRTLALQLGPKGNRIDEGIWAVPLVTAVWSAADRGVVANNAPIEDGGRPDAKLLCRSRCTQPRKRIRSGERGGRDRRAGVSTDDDQRAEAFTRQLRPAGRNWRRPRDRDFGIFRGP